MAARYVLPLESLRMADVPAVGGKNASLGELISQLLAHNRLADSIREALSSVDVDDVAALARAGAKIRAQVEAGALPPDLEKQIRDEYARVSKGDPASFAVRSSATAEDLPDASFAGQQETYLNIRGVDNVLEAVKRVYASLYNDRAIAYRVHKGFAHQEVAISAGVQRMVRSDKGAAGVMFTMDTESGFREVVFITSSYGLGETVVQGSVNPDEFYVSKLCLANGKPAILRRGMGAKAIKLVFAEEERAGKSVAEVEVGAADRDRFSLADGEVEELGRYALAIEKHYGRPMDIEWGRDGEDGKLYVLQARPETVKSQEKRRDTLTRYRIGKRGDVLASGRAIGSKIGQGRVRVIMDVSEIARVQEGDVLVTDMTDPNWEPVMKRASAIVTNRGGRTCHAAIIARELGVPAVVGCEDATHKLAEGAEVTVSCAEGDTGYIYRGKMDYEAVEVALDRMPAIPVKIAMNVGNPQLAFDFCQLPNEGVGLARLEFIISNTIGVHPKACLEFASLPADLKAQVARQARGYADPVRFYVEKIVEGVATIAAAFWPKKVIVRLSDFKSNEYRNLIGGARFDLECEAMRKVRDEMGLTNVELMVPFVRTLKEAEQVLALLRENGLERGKNALRIVMMCEIPSNALLADEFLRHFDGFSIGSNDMTQLTLALDRDSGLVMQAFDERDAAVKRMLRLAIQACRKHGKYIGICGQGPSDYPDLAEWLMQEGIESMSLNPDTVVETWLHLARVASPKAAV